MPDATAKYQANSEDQRDSANCDHHYNLGIVRSPSVG